MIDWEEGRFLPATLVLGLTGAAATMMTLALAAFEVALWPICGALAALLCVTAATIGPARPRSVQLARWLGPPSMIVWLGAILSLEGDGDPSVAVFCLGMAALCASVPRWISDEAPPMDAGPPVFSRGEAPSSTSDGWIEELDEPVARAPASRMRRSPDRRRAELAP